MDVINRYFRYGSPLDNAYIHCYKASKKLIEKYQKDRKNLTDETYDKVNHKFLVPKSIVTVQVPREAKEFLLKF